MGEEQIAARESIYNNQADDTYFGIDSNLLVHDTVRSCSFSSNKLIYVHNAVFGYNRCKFNFTLRQL
jgi:hypothetical protein